MILPDLQFSVLCDDVRREQNGKFILIGLFEVVGTRKLPAVHPKLTVVNRWVNGLGDFSQQIRLVSGETDAIIGKDKEIPFALSNTRRSHTVVSAFAGIRLEKAGTYWVEVLLKGELKLRYPFEVVLVKPKS
jgi:hypothetical protein